MNMAPGPKTEWRTCVFTIVSRNYLHYALNLMESVAAFLPHTHRTIVLCDAGEGVDLTDAGIELIDIDALNIAHVDRMIVQYTILELNTAIKPYAFSKLFASGPWERVIYFDPDIQLFSSGTPLLQRLDHADVVLTPHLTAPLMDDRHPSDLSIVQSGSYNLGFLALRRSAGTARLLRWWEAKLQRDCVVDIPRGLFTDQKWMDLVPGLFERVYIERDPGWNVAYWNLAHRHVDADESGFRVNGQPLFFFHFSGYDPKTRSISKHQDRYTLERCTPAVQALFRQYVERLDRQGRERYAAIPYAYATLADGTVLPECARQVIRQELEWDKPLPDLRSAEGARTLVRMLTEPVDQLDPPLTRLALQLHRSRPDLHAAFPDVLGAHREAYAAWFVERAGEEARVSGELLRGVGTVARASAVARAASDADSGGTEGTHAGAQAVALPGVGTAPAGTRPGGSPLFRWAYRLAWQGRHLARPLSTPALRQRVRAYLVRRAFASRPAAAATAANVAVAQGAALPPGITVIGYLQAESGVGESARSTLRALATIDIAHSVRDFRAGNVSRMEAALDGPLVNDRQHAISLFHINADQMPLARTMLGEGPFAAQRRIGFWAWELERFPKEWWSAFAHVDEVWVPSTFCQRAIGEASPVPVVCMPHSIAIPSVAAADRARFGLRPGSVAFLAMADMLSSAARKNPLGAIEAFIAAFAGRTDDVELVIKISNADRDTAAMARLRDLAAQHTGVHVLPDYLDRSALNCLLDSVDCFVSLHRAEGFGLVIAEAMVRGKVVVATGWSGNMDFMTAENALPVDYTLRVLDRDHGPYRQGERWAEPALDDAIAKLRQVASDEGLRRRIGQRARHDCIEMLAPEVIGDRIRRRIDAISSRSEA
jgi:glycosyltransferase involved in cell wall biosynthesis